MYITNRERVILDILLKSQPLFITVSSIAKELDVSTRTIQREIKTIEDTLGKLNIFLIKKPNLGIKIKGDKEAIIELQKIINAPLDSELTREERIIIIFYKFMMESGPLKSNILSKELSISTSTLMQDLSYFEERIKGLPLKLIRRTGYGLELIGSERNKRIALVNMMMGRLEGSSIFSIKEEQFMFLNFMDKVLGVMDMNTVLQVERWVLEGIKNLPYRITDYSILEILLYVSLSIERMKRKVALREIKDKLTNNVEYKTACIILDKVEEELKIHIPKGEIEFLAINLKGAKRTKEFDISANNHLNLIALDLIESVSERTGYYFNKQKTFMDGLISHLEPLFNRVKEGIFVDNPIKEDIKQEYSILFQSIDSILKEKFLGLNFSEDEVGFLTIHLASAITTFTQVPMISTLVICGSGIGTSRMLSKKLIDNFPQLTIIEQASIRELTNMEIEKFDLIISTIGIYDADFNYVLVNPMLTEEDKAKLSKIINTKLLDVSKDIKEHLKRDSNRILHKIDLINKNNIILEEILGDFTIVKTKGRTLRGVIYEIEEDIKDLNIAKRYIISDYLLEKEKTIGSGIPNCKITFLHGRSDEIHRSIFRIYRNSNDIIVKGMDSKEQSVNTILFLMAPEELNKFQLDILSSISITLLESIARKTFTHGSQEEVYSFLENQLALSYMELLNKIWRE